MRADLIIHPRYTLTLDPERPRADGLAVAGGRIIAWGDRESLAALRGPHTEVLDSDHVLLPAFRDAHLHLRGLGESLSRLQLQGLSLDELLHAVSTDAGEGWLLGRGWDETRWPEGFPDSAAPLSSAAPERPVALSRVDGHALWINQALMDQLGIDAETPDPPGGHVARDARGRPTGLLVDNAMELAPRPEPDHATLKGYIQRGAAHLHGLGIAHACDMGVSPAELAALHDEAPRLHVEAYLDAHRGAAPQAPFSRGSIHVVGAKLYADGALGSRGAWLHAPYADADTRGLAVLSPQQLRDWMARYSAEGLQIATHAIGDAAATAVLDAYEALGLEAPRLEHAQLLTDADVDRMARLGVIACAQPLHFWDDLEMAPRRLGVARLARAYPWRRLLARGIPLPLGSDAPIASADPLRGLWAARAREDEEALSPLEALRGFTAGPLRLGGPADLVLLDRDPLTSPPRALLEARVEGLFVEGRRASG